MGVSLSEIAAYWSVEADVAGISKSKNKWLQMSRIADDFRGTVDRTRNYATNKLAARESGKVLSQEIARDSRQVYVRGKGYTAIPVSADVRYVKNRKKFIRRNYSGPARRGLTQMLRGARRRPEKMSARALAMQRLSEGYGALGNARPVRASNRVTKGVRRSQIT